jgi:hypothetical protein
MSYVVVFYWVDSQDCDRLRQAQAGEIKLFKTVKPPLHIDLSNKNPTYITPALNSE